MSISPDPGGKRRFSSTNINLVCLCHGTTNPNGQLVNMTGSLTIDCDSGADIYQGHKVVYGPVPEFTKQCGECV